MDLRLAVLGDSIAWGQGASRAQDRLAPRLTAGLARHGVAAETTVVAVPGARSAHLAGQLGRVLAWGPDAAVIVVGANDITHLTPTDEAVRDLADCVRRLRETGAEVVVAPAPDLSSVPHVPPALRPVVRSASEELRRRQAAAVRALGGRIADGDHATSRAFAADPRLFSADRYHPSSAGYAMIADAILPELLAAVDLPAAG